MNIQRGFARLAGGQMALQAVQQLLLRRVAGLRPAGALRVGVVQGLAQFGQKAGVGRQPVHGRGSLVGVWVEIGWLGRRAGGVWVWAHGGKIRFWPRSCA